MDVPFEWLKSGPRNVNIESRIKLVDNKIVDERKMKKVYRQEMH